MSSTDIYQPYTYLIGWSEHNLWYYGVGFAKGCNPSDLWVRYFTSSKLVAKCRCKYGEPDVVTVRRTFKCRTSAIDWEQKVLRRLKVVKSHMWLNCSTARQNHNKIDQAARNISTFQTHDFRQKQSSSMKELYSNALKDVAYRETTEYKEKQSISTQNSYRQGKKRPSLTHTRGVEVDGIAYGSVTEAAKIFGVTNGTVLRRIKSPKTPS